MSSRATDALRQWFAQHREGISVGLCTMGRRGTVLACLGLIWVFTGVQALFGASSPQYYLLSVSPEARAAAWFVTGSIALSCVLKPQGKDALGFLALYVMAAYRIVAYGVGFGVWLVNPSSHWADSRGIVGVLSWAVVVVLIIVVSGWSEAEPPRSTEEVV